MKEETDLGNDESICIEWLNSKEIMVELNLKDDDNNTITFRGLVEVVE